MKFLNVKTVLLAASLSLVSMFSHAAGLEVSDDINPAPLDQHYNFEYSELPSSFTDYISLTLDVPSSLVATVSGTSSIGIDFDNFDILSFDKSTTLVTGTLLNPSSRSALGFATDDALAAGSYWLFIKGTSTGAASYNGTISVVAAVPEPESYAMMLAGLGLMGFIARRRSV